MGKFKLIVIVILIISGGILSWLFMSKMNRSGENVVMSKIVGNYTYSVIKVYRFDSFGNSLDSFFKFVIINEDESVINLLPRFSGRPISLAIENSDVVIIREVDGGFHKDVFRIGEKGQKSVEFIPSLKP